MCGYLCYFHRTWQRDPLTCGATARADLSGHLGKHPDARTTRLCHSGVPAADSRPVVSSAAEAGADALLVSAGVIAARELADWLDTSPRDDAPAWLQCGRRSQITIANLQALLGQKPNSF